MRVARARDLRTWLTLLLVAACDVPATVDDADALADEDEGSADDATDDGSDDDVPTWGEPVPLAVASAWALASAEDDPLASERPASVDCPVAAWGPEAAGLEIQTGACNYFFATQPSRAAIEPGDAIDVVTFHQGLDAPEPAEGHVAILVGDAVVWEAYVEIPADASVLEARVIAARAWPAGTPVGVHLHNHGYNAWTVLDVTVAPQE